MREGFSLRLLSPPGDGDGGFCFLLLVGSADVTHDASPLDVVGAAMGVSTTGRDSSGWLIVLFVIFFLATDLPCLIFLIAATIFDYYLFWPWSYSYDIVTSLEFIVGSLARCVEIFRPTKSLHVELSPTRCLALVAQKLSSIDDINIITANEKP